MLEGYEEHHVVDLLMGELEDLDVSDESWGAKAIVMKENVEHHMEEEEGEMFAKVTRSSTARSSRIWAPGWPSARRVPSGSSAFPTR